MKRHLNHPCLILYNLKSKSWRTIIDKGYNKTHRSWGRYWHDGFGRSIGSIKSIQNGAMPFGQFVSIPIGSSVYFHIASLYRRYLISKPYYTMKACT